ncbi:MAG: hypothetical protein ABI571_03260, partial [Actinomycetota bacterium]
CRDRTAAFVTWEVRRMAGTMVPASGVAAGLRKIDAKLADIERALDGSDLIGAGAETMWLRNRLTALCAALDLHGSMDTSSRRCL